MRNVRILAAAAFLAACTPAAPPPAAETPTLEASIPRESIADAYPDCQWGDVQVAGVALGAFTCPGDRIVADPALPGFVRETTVDGSVLTAPVVQFLSKAPDAPLESLQDAVRALSPGGEACDLQAGANGYFVLMPVGEALAAYQRYVEGQGGDVPIIPCGPLGPQEAGGVTFTVVNGAPDKVAMIFNPSDAPLFDPDTLRAVPAP